MAHSMFVMSCAIVISNVSRSRPNNNAIKPSPGTRFSVPYAQITLVTFCGFKRCITTRSRPSTALITRSAGMCLILARAHMELPSS